VRFTALHNRTHHAKVGVPAAVLGVLAGSVTGAPAGAATASVPAPPPTETAPLRLPAAAQGSVPAATPDAPATYTVQPGDTVSTIAARFGLAAADVLTWNGLGWRSVIYPGQSLALIAPAADAAPVESAPNEATPAAGASTHTVVAGDTIFRIAQQQGVSVGAVLSANSLADDSIIYPGQTLTIPAAASAASTAASAPASVADTTDHALNAPQAENAALIIRIGRELGIPDRGIAIALATSMVESWLRNLDHGDRDSLGLFQQRPSTGWGTPEQIRDREHSIRAFYGGAHDPNGTTTRGLLDIPGWESMGFADAAQAVQISAHPDRYTQWEAPAYAWLALYG